MSDKVNHPSHYNQQFIEAIDIIELFCNSFDFCIGNFLKYILRAPYKNDAPFYEHLQKANWYLDRAILNIPMKMDTKIFSKFEHTTMCKYFNNLSNGDENEYTCSDILSNLYGIFNVASAGFSKIDLVAMFNKLHLKLEMKIDELKRAEKEKENGNKESLRS